MKKSLNLKLRPDDKVFAVGMSGFGKTTLILYLLDNLKRYIIYDTTGEFIKALDLPVAENLVDFFEYIESGEPRLIYSSEDKNDFDKICRIVYAMGNAYLIVDEIDKFCDPQKLPLYWEKIINYGRKYKVGYIVATRRPAKVHRDVSSQATRVISFGQHELSDIEWLKGMVPKEKVLELPPFRFVHYNNRTGATKTMELPGKYVKR